MLGSTLQAALFALVVLFMVTCSDEASASVTNASAKPTVTITINPAQIVLGGSATLTWSSSNTSSCTASGDWFGSKPTASSDKSPYSVSPFVVGTFQYYLSCSGSDGSMKTSATLKVISHLDQQIEAAQQTAGNTDPDSSCGAIDQNSSGNADGFYWEIGNKDGIIADTHNHLSASDSVQPADTSGTNYTRDSQLEIASASKWMYGAYVAETKAALKSTKWQFPAAYIPFLNLTSGYNDMTDSCPYNITPTVQDCLNYSNGSDPAVPNGTLTTADVGFFDYNSGHMEVFEGGAAPAIAGAMNGANNDDSALASEIETAFSARNVTVNLSFDAPIPAGGIVTTPGDYASFLQGIIRSVNPLLMSHFLNPTSSDPYAVCTSYLDPSCVNSSGVPLSIYSPIPPTLYWHYSIGHWIEDDPVTGDGAYSSAGKYGFYPWIDSTESYYGVVARYDTSTTTAPLDAPFYQSALCGAAIRKAFMSATVQP